MPATSIVGAILERMRTKAGEAAVAARDWRAQVREDPAALFHSPMVRICAWLLIGGLVLGGVVWFARGLTPDVGGAFGDQPSPYATLYVACTNSSCLASYNTRQKMDFKAWPLKCEKCGQATVYRGQVCRKCREWYATAPATSAGAAAAGCPHCAKRDAADVKPAPATQKAVDRDDAEDGW